MEYDKSEHNPGLRALAKMVLNSMWGKFGQRLNKTQVETCDDPQAFHRFLDTDSVDVRHVSVKNEQMVEVYYQYPLSVSRRRHPRVSQPQHFHGLFQHLLGTSPSQ